MTFAAHLHARQTKHKRREISQLNTEVWSGFCGLAYGKWVFSMTFCAMPMPVGI